MILFDTSSHDNTTRGPQRGEQDDVAAHYQKSKENFTEQKFLLL